jgi:large subunit ribosomal protein L9
MKVILQSDVRNLGKVGDVVKVAAGYARNFLFPRKLAQAATEKREKEFNHLKAVAAKKMLKVKDDRKVLATKLSGMTLTFTKVAGEGDKLFGSVTNSDISEVLFQQGISVDKRDIQVPDAIKMLGQHQAIVKLGEGIEAELKINVERQAAQ